MRIPLLVAVATVLAVTQTGCAMSPRAYDELAAEVAERNQVRYDAALEAFWVRGFEGAVDAVRFAAIDEADRQRCFDVIYGHHLHGGAAAEASASDDIRFTVAAATPAGGTPSPRLGLSAPADAACAFFASRATELEGVDAAGETVGIVSIGGQHLVRSAAGDLVYFDVIVHVTSKRTVLVDDECNEMPDPGPEPIDRPNVRVVFAPAPTERVSMEVEREELDYECTHVVE